jgi:hypothetical protein
LKTVSVDGESATTVLARLLIAAGEAASRLEAVPRCP